MFTDDTARLIEDAFGARESSLKARAEASKKTAARTTAADDEAKALASLQDSLSAAASARDAAMKAVADELAIPAEEAPPAAARTFPMPSGQRPRTVGVR